MVLVFLGPADEDRAVEPRVTRLGHSAAWPPVGVAGLEVDLFTASADVRGELECVRAQVACTCWLAALRLRQV